MAQPAEARRAAGGRGGRAHIRERLAAPNTRRYWAFLDAFPLTESRKVQRFVRRERRDAGEVEFTHTTARRPAAG